MYGMTKVSFARRMYLSMSHLGSPDTENWCIDDELQHELTVSSFYIDPYEMTQEEYERLTGENLSIFIGEKLPVDNSSWLDAVSFANAKSEAAGQTDMASYWPERPVQESHVFCDSWTWVLA